MAFIQLLRRDGNGEKKRIGLLSCLVAFTMLITSFASFVLPVRAKDVSSSVKIRLMSFSVGNQSIVENGALIDYDIKELTMNGYQVSYTRLNGEKTVNNEVAEYKNIVVTNTKVPSAGTPNIIIPIDPLPFTPPAGPDVPTFIPPDVPKEVEEFLLDDEDVVRV